MIKTFFTRLLEILAYVTRFTLFVMPVTFIEGLALIFFSKKEVVAGKLIVKPAKSLMDSLSIIDKLNIDNIDLYKGNTPIDDDCEEI